jgi:hypothetical protein
MSQSRTGGCLCGAVRYRVDGLLRPVVMCHCSQCRRQTGHFLAATAAGRADFVLLHDEELRWYAASDAARRGFCGRCGSTLFWDGKGLDYLSIAAGSLDDSAALPLAGHIFTADKGGYYDINPSEPQVPDGSFHVQFPHV